MSISRNLRARRERAAKNGPSPRLPTRTRDVGTVPLMLRRLAPMVRFGYPIGITVGPARVRVVANVDCFQMLKFTAGVVLALARSPFACVGLVYGVQHIHGMVIRARERMAREEQDKRRLEGVVEHAAPEFEPMDALPTNVPIGGDNARDDEETVEDDEDAADDECASECSEWSVISEVTTATVVISATQQD
jgi:hypothetical protein